MVKAFDLCLVEDTNMVEVYGDITFACAAEVYKAGTALVEKYQDLTFSFLNVRTIDACALSILLGWLRVARNCHHKLSFRGIPKEIIDIASLSNVRQFLES